MVAYWMLDFYTIFALNKKEMSDYKKEYKQYLAIKEVAILQDNYIKSLEEATGMGGVHLSMLRHSNNLDASNENYQRFRISLGLNFDNLMDKICLIFEESKRDVLSARRDREFVTPRHLFCYFVLQHLPLTTPKEIADYLGRDRSTIYNNVDAAKSLLLYDKPFARKYDELKAAML
jgi:hypothetical protein